MAVQRTAPNATLAAHALVGWAGGKALHAVFKPGTDGGKIIAWLVGAAVLIRLHNRMDLPMARLISATLPVLG